MIRTELLSKTYRTGFLMQLRPALNGVSLEVRKGEIFGFIGPNGAGKSTTIKILTGLLRPTSGKVQLLGGSPQDPACRAKIGYMPEQPYFYDYLTGWELMRFFASLSGLKGREINSRIQESLALVHADQDWIHRRLRSYSKGMMQRVGLAQAVLARPELLILDEPMSGLDPLGRKDVREAILSLNRNGTTIFYSSHVLSDVETISHRVAMVVEGRIVRQGTVDEITGEEATSYLVHTLTDLDAETLPAQVDKLRPQEFRCADVASRDALLKLCLDSGTSVEKLESSRTSLEDVLAREVARA